MNVLILDELRNKWQRRLTNMERELDTIDQNSWVDGTHMGQKMSLETCIQELEVLLELFGEE